MIVSLPAPPDPRGCRCAPQRRPQSERGLAKYQACYCSGSRIISQQTAPPSRECFARKSCARSLRRVRPELPESLEGLLPVMLGPVADFSQCFAATSEAKPRVDPLEKDDLAVRHHHLVALFSPGRGGGIAEIARNFAEPGFANFEVIVFKDFHVSLLSAKTRA